MKKFYFTFGIVQSLLATRFVEIEAENYETAREIMLESFGTKWCWQYTEEEWTEKNIAAQYDLQKLNINVLWR